ncbi:hypothetical protein ACFWAR_23135 [Streptomyces sp. NPDC059917]|uniref:hypothetical protein n=1 Tax=Streptomyces sp. NPDC059917 TaxID=3347002 RepID=UPI003660EE5E
MKRRLQLTEQVARFVDHYMPATDREVFERVTERLLDDPEGEGTYLAYLNDPVTRMVREGHVMIEYVATSWFVVVVETDVYDASRGFNEPL